MRSPSGQPRAALPAESAYEMVTALALDEEVALPARLLSPSYSSGMEDIWVVATKQHASKDGVVYVLNNHRLPKWFYGFTSGATKAQRDMRHTLVAYVFRLHSPPLDDQQAQPDPADRPLHATVLARQASPSFTIGSYRRANSTQGREASVTAPDPQTEHASTEEAAVESVAVQRAAAVDTRNDLHAASSEGGDESEDEETPVVVEESRSGDVDVDVDVSVGRTGVAVEERLEETKEHVEQDNAMFWHLDDLTRHSDVAEKAKHLLLLRFFLGAATIDVFGCILPRLDDHIRAN
ncbi:hypothetical protein BBJ28_00024841 [Nothophytophthora sp. Chile5]|nr:hypothetical protein BBJ28_00024841 [Nothophytophthora sp. Chile5]